MSITLAEAFVALRVDDSGVDAQSRVAGAKAGASFGASFDADARKGTANVGKTISGSTVPAAKKAGTDAGKSFGSSFGTSLKSLAIGGGALLGFSALTSELHAINDEARESQKVGALTNAVLESTGAVANVTAGHVADLANAISLKVGQDDEAIQSGANVLLTFRNIRNEVGVGNDIFDQATLAVTNISAALGKDLKGSAIQVGKALNDPIAGVTALGRAGVQFTAEQKEQIKTLVETGHSMDAQKIILSELTAEFGGAAEAQATAGDKASVAWANVEETLGQRLLPVLDDVLTWFATDGIHAMADFGSFLDQDVIPPARVLGGIVVDTAEAFDSLPGPVKDAAIAMGLVVVAQKAMATTRVVSVLDAMSTRYERVKVTAGLAGDAVATSAARMKLLGGAAKIAAGAGGLLLVEQGAKNADSALGALESAAGGAATGFAVAGPWGAAIGGAAGLLKGLVDGSDAAAEAQQALDGEVKTLTQSLIDQKGVLASQDIADIAAALQEAISPETFTALGVGLDQVTAAAAGSSKDLAEINTRIEQIVASAKTHLDDLRAAREQSGPNALLDQQISEAQRQYLNLASGADAVTGAIHDQTGAIAAARDGYKKHQATLDAAKYAQGGLNDSVKDGSKRFDENKQSVDDATKALQGYRQVQASMISKQLGLSQAIIDANKALRENADGFDKNTQAGIDNYNVVLRIAESTDGMKASTDQGRESIERARQAIIDYATAQGKTIPEAKELATRLLGVRDAGKAVNDQPINPKVAVDTGAARNELDAFKAYANRTNDGINDEVVNFEMSAQASKIASQLGAVHAATGGAIHGPGTGTSDSIPARLSNNEHVVENAAVYGAGGGDYNRGHKIWAGLRFLARQGRLGHMGDLGLPGFADGGAVRVSPDISTSGFAAAAAQVQAYYDAIAARLSASLSKRGNDYLTELPTGTIGGLGSGGSLTPAQIVRGQNFAKTQSGKPYQWGGIGNPSWDCSGFVGGVLLAAKGLDPHQRIGTTASMPWQGFSRGTGTFTVGNDPGSHMAGAIGGMGIESNGYYGVKAGPLNTPLGSFADLWKYDTGGIVPPGIRTIYNGTGKNETLRTPEQDKQLVGLSDEQRRMARTIISVGQSMDMSVRDIRIAIMTALQESTLRNLNYGDRDSIGLFQQRPSQGWGTQAQIMDPQYSSRKFYEALRGIADRENMTMAQAAQAVQRSADGSLYIDDRVHATDIVKSLLGSGDGAGGRGGTHGQDARAASQEAHQAAREQAQRERELARSIDHFRITARESAGDVHDQAAELIKSLRETFGGDSPIVDNMADLGTQMVAAARERDKVTEELSSAVGHLQKLQDSNAQLVASTASAFSADVFGATGAQTVQGMQAYLRDQLAQTRAFGTAEDKLIDKGLSKSLIRQLVGTGPDALRKAQALARLSPRELKEFSELAARQAKEARKIGESAGRALYGDGIKAAEGVVAGLRKERAQITRELTHLAAVAVRAVTARLGDVDSNGHRGPHKPRAHDGNRHRADGNGHRNGPLVHIEHQHVRDEKAAAREEERKWREALALAGG